MVTHDFLIENGFSFRKFEGSPENSYAGSYMKMSNDKDFLLITLDKFSNKENDFTDIVFYVTYGNREIKVKGVLKPLTKDVFHSIINIVTT